MYKRFSFLFFFGVIVFGVSVAPTYAQEQITSFDADMTINDDARVDVTETIVYDFGTARRHGIFRDIPVRYHTTHGFMRSTDITDISVRDADGRAWPFRTSRHGSDQRLTIGDASRFVSGQQTYVIHYTIRDVINYFDDHDELYWNVTGNGWSVPIMQARSSVHAPGIIRQECFSGRSGSTTPCTEVRKDQHLADTVTFVQKHLAKGEGLTVVVGIKKGMIAGPSLWHRVVVFGRRFVLPIVASGTLLWLGLRKRFRRYRAYSRYKKKHPVIAQYDAGDFSPYEASYLHNGQYETSNLSALIVWLATQGYVTIIEQKKGVYIFQIPRGVDTTALPEAQRKILSLLVQASPLGKDNASQKREAIQTLRTLNKECFAQATTTLHNRGFLKQKPKTTVSAPIASSFSRRWGSFLFLFLAINPGFFLWQVNIMLGATFSATMVLFAVVGFFFPPRPDYTPAGLRAENQIKGLYLYIKTAEKNRLAVLNRYAKTPDLFEKLLPFAMIFGLEKKWTKTFEGVLKDMPSWYQSEYATSFSPVVFASSMHTMNSVVGMRSSSASMGHSGFSGGSSGGGFGGGGGGSW